MLTAGVLAEGWVTVGVAPAGGAFEPDVTAAGTLGAGVVTIGVVTDGVMTDGMVAEGTLGTAGALLAGRLGI